MAQSVWLRTRQWVLLTEITPPCSKTYLKRLFVFPRTLFA